MNCPTCKKPNCGNHAACARRATKAIEDAEKREAWAKEWGKQFLCIARMEEILDKNARADVPRERVRDLLLEVLKAHQLVQDVWDRLRIQALLEATEE